MIPKAPDAIRVTYDLPSDSDARRVRTFTTTDMREAIDLIEQAFPLAYIISMERTYAEDN